MKRFDFIGIWIRCQFSDSRHQPDSIVSFASDILKYWVQIHSKAESQDFRSVPISLNLDTTSEKYERIESKHQNDSKIIPNGEIRPDFHEKWLL